MNMRSPLSRMHGLGSAKASVGHWWAQRVTAIALIPLTLWFVAGLLSLIGAEHAAVVAWIGSPVPAVLLVLLLTISFYHAQLGLQAVFEDYVHHQGLKLAATLFVKFACLLLGAAAVFGVLKLVFLG